MPSEFVHLHLHSDYSLLDGACSVSGIVKMAEAYKMRAVAMTDHGFMGGLIDFYQQMNAAKIKPIIGCEAYISPTTRFDRDPNNPNIRGFHVVLLAKNEAGYKNLCKLIAEANLNGMYYKPRIDREILAKHHDGLIALSACIKGEIPSAILDGKIKDAKRILREYLDMMGKENFYLEIMDHGLEEQKKINRELILLSKEFDVPLVATNDVHYLKEEHAKAHELMLCIQTRSTINDPKHFKFSSDQFYFKNGVEMRELFKEVPEAVKNTLEVAEKCNVVFTFAPAANHYPVYQIEGNTDRKKYLRDICLQGIRERYGFEPLDAGLDAEKKKTLERMDYELNIIDNSHYTSYFLVVWDFLRYAKQSGIPVGPGRGSGAGSIVAYLTRITDVDPLRYKLLFERFLNPERISPPDFDIDFCERRRTEVIEYVRKKYGAENVAQIGTYGTLKAKAVIKDIARVTGHSIAESDLITKLIPNDPKMTLKKAIEASSEMRELINKEAWVKEIFDYAEALEGLNRNMTIHAAGVIIGDQKLNGLVPLAKGSAGEIITQYSAKPCENLGLLKMDFLGLKTLTIIQDAIDNIKKFRGQEIIIDNLPLDDQPTFNLLNRGDTVAVFQLESDGMQNLCRQFGVETIEHIIALIAIYRPGPMEFIPDFVSRKMGQSTFEYEHPAMEPILKETYGIMLYQEQVMQIVQALAGFTPGQADTLRAAISKKKVKDIELLKAKFLKDAPPFTKISEKTANIIWEKIAKFAGYGFNKSHSAAYAFLAYRTAYLKANYPVEFMTAVLASEIDNAEKIAFFINECREMEISILPPDVNSSDINFTVNGSSIRFGLGAIKGVGSNAANAIISSREKEGPFKSMLDFCERAGSSVNTRMLEHLIRSGAFDTFKVKRSQLIEITGAVLSMAQSTIKDKESGQGSLFDMLPEAEREDTFAIPLPDIPEFDENEMLKDEKALLGFYVTGHPLAKYAELIKTFSTVNLLKAKTLEHDTGIKIGGIIKSVQKRRSKKDDKPYAIVQLEDLEGSMECMVYNKLFEKELDEDLRENDSTIFVKDLLEDEKPIFVEAFVNQRDENEVKKLIAEKIVPMSAVSKKYTRELHLHVFEVSTKHKDLEDIKELCGKHPGESRVIFCVKCANGDIAYLESSDKTKVSVDETLLHKIQEVLGERRYKLKADKAVPIQKNRFYRNGANGKNGQEAPSQ
ncbi:MAG: DNA polymerase III subunit alpha [Lentisphaerae bacterium GWF2_44_16]|nr:MAG: DNA polymerase III subunit alpha [Lentisphaerae bacterium GWF2_44_16]